MGALAVRSRLALAAGREDSPWYPTMRLFRQERQGDWDGVFERIAAAVTCETRRGVRILGS